MPSNLTVYRASAGSGKTFTLATEFIALLMANPMGRAHSKILAVTFTNKATAEMKDRILEQLYGMWKGLPSSHSYLQALKAKPNIAALKLSEEEMRQRAGVALKSILHDYSRFRVETIDSFFQSVLKNLAHELNLTANLKVDLRDQDVIDAAVERIMNRLHLTPSIMHWIMDYVMDRIGNDRKWDISNEVKSFGKNIFREDYLKHEQELTDLLGDSKKVAEYKKKLDETRNSVLDILKSLAVNCEEQMQQMGIDYSNISRGNNLKSFMNKLLEGNLEDVKISDTMKKYASEPTTLLRTADRKKPQLVAIANELGALLEEIIKYYNQLYCMYCSVPLTTEYLNPLRLLSEINKEVTRINNENNRFLLAKTPILLNELVADSDAPFIFEKIGNTFEHIMIDEFQDTSSLQWKNFKVLLNESLSQGHYNLLVGDVKQSIYRWRGGDWEILNSIEKEMKAFEPLVRNLKNNFRSERNIINFNNAFFTRASAQLDSVTEEEDGRIAQAYADTVQLCPEHRPEKGHVQVKFYHLSSKKKKKDEAEEEELPAEDRETEMLDDMCEQAARLLDHGVAPGDIAILIRKNKHAGAIINHFAQRLPRVKLVSGEAFQLNGSKAVNLLVHAMRYLNNVNDRVALAYLAHNTPTTGDKDLSMLATPLETLVPEAFLTGMERLKRLPLYELQEELYKIFSLGEIAGQEDYLFTFLDELCKFTEDNPSDISSFLNYWDSSLCRKSIPESEVDGIRILSIHKSKGLQYHTVFAPYMNFPLGKEPFKEMMWCSPQVEPFNELALAPITLKQELSKSIYKYDYNEEYFQRHVDAINLLYVAFTRAEKNLYIWAPTTRTLSPNATAAELIYNTLPLHIDNEKVVTCEGPEGTMLEEYSLGMPVWGEANQKGEDQAPDNRPNRMALKPETIKACLQSFDARIDFKQSNAAQDFIEMLTTTDEEAALRKKKRTLGILLHKVFARIKTLDDLDKTLLTLENEGAIASVEERNAIAGMVKDAFKSPMVESWFNGRWELYNECPILTGKMMEDTGKYALYRPDRVMCSPDNIIVVDFKFGKHRKEYQQQVGQYMDLLKQMEPGKQVKGYLWYIMNQSIEEVII